MDAEVRHGKAMPYATFSPPAIDWSRAARPKVRDLPSDGNSALGDDQDRTLLPGSLPAVRSELGHRRTPRGRTTLTLGDLSDRLAIGIEESDRNGARVELSRFCELPIPRHKMKRRPGQESIERNRNRKNLRRKFLKISQRNFCAAPVCRLMSPTGGSLKIITKR